MKITIIKIDKKTYSLNLVQGNQSFGFAYDGNKKECEWYLRMLRKAFKRAGIKLDKS